MLRRAAAGDRDDAIPLFVCHANCCRSVLASYLYRHLCGGAPALSAGLQPGERTSDRAIAVLSRWGIDASGHRPTQCHRDLCVAASAVFVMAPPYVRRLLLEYGADLATKVYLYKSPFTRPTSLHGADYTVSDPSFDARPVSELAAELAWMRDSSLQIRESLLAHGRPLVPAADYLDLLESVDPTGH